MATAQHADTSGLTRECIIDAATAWARGNRYHQVAAACITPCSGQFPVSNAMRHLLFLVTQQLLQMGALFQPGIEGREVARFVVQRQLEMSIYWRNDLKIVPREPGKIVVTVALGPAIKAIVPAGSFDLSGGRDLKSSVSLSLTSQEATSPSSSRALSLKRQRCSRPDAASLSGSPGARVASRMANVASVPPKTQVFSASGTVF
jgi:hypothetical protein